MEQVTVFVAVAVLLILALVVTTVRRTARPAPLGPARLGPTWKPSGSVDSAPRMDEESRRQQVDALADRTDLPAERVELVLRAWEEYLSVLGIEPLPADHHYLVYDPYLPPVAERGPDGPIPDRLRVARDLAVRARISQSAAMTVLAAEAEMASDRDTAS